MKTWGENTRRFAATARICSGSLIHQRTSLRADAVFDHPSCSNLTGSIMRCFRSILCIALASLLVLAAATPLAPARDNGQWENSPPNVRRWFQGLRQPDNPRMSCCGEADAYEADIFEVDGGHYVAVITDGKGEIPNGTKIPVPNNKIKWDEGNPTGHGIIFIGLQGQVYCYVLPGGV
jgi:hypothetical protein